MSYYFSIDVQLTTIPATTHTLTMVDLASGNGYGDSICSTAVGVGQLCPVKIFSERQKRGINA